jgi:hypothetical protein
MGCAGSKPSGPPPPPGAPDDWKAKAMAAFGALDKEKAGYITTVPSKQRDTKFSEIFMLGDEVIKKQQAAGDLELNLAVDLATWIGVVRTRCEDESIGWEKVGAFLEAIVASVEAADDAERKKKVEEKAALCFKGLDEDWADPPKTGAVDVAAECETLGDNTAAKVKSLLAGLEAGTAVGSEAFVAHVLGKMDALGWPRVLKMLSTIIARVEKAKDLADAF